MSVFTFFHLKRLHGEKKTLSARKDTFKKRKFFLLPIKVKQSKLVQVSQSASQTVSQSVDHVYLCILKFIRSRQV